MRFQLLILIAALDSLENVVVWCVFLIFRVGPFAYLSLILSQEVEIWYIDAVEVLDLLLRGFQQQLYTLIIIYVCVIVYPYHCSRKNYPESFFLIWFFNVTNLKIFTLWKSCSKALDCDSSARFNIFGLEWPWVKNQWYPNVGIERGKWQKLIFFKPIDAKLKDVQHIWKSVS